MAIPSGSGTEVLKRSYVDGTSDTEQTLITGVANHIYTIISINFTNMSGSDELIDMYILQGGVTYMLLRKQPIPTDSTFIFNDKIVISGAGNLQANLDTSGDCDVWVSYIDQDWT